MRVKNYSSLAQRLVAALSEDGAFDDVTTGALIQSKSTKLKAFLLCKADGIFSGGFLAGEIFGLLDRSSRVTSVVKDGTRVRRGMKLAHIQASPSALLAGERVLLNLICHLSGVATLTRKYVEAVRGTKARILDTRKTTPLWRDQEKHAVLSGGGENHRFSLSDAILVKDNHWEFAAKSGLSISRIFGPDSKFRKGKARPTFVAIEATTHAQVWEAIKARADIILLDNMPENQLKEAIVFIEAARRALKSASPQIEISGGVDLAGAKRLARLGADRISVGALTHSAPAMDISLEVADGRL